MQKKQLGGRKFRRQHSIGKYIVDFYCPVEKLVIELDGADHYTPAGSDYDDERDAYLKSLGLNILRFENIEVFNFLEAVLEEIMGSFKNQPPRPATAGHPSFERRGIGTT